MAPRPRRMIAALTVLSLAVLVGAAGARGAGRRSGAVVFAPYVDMTLDPPPNLTAIHRASGVRQTSLGFVVAQPGAACAPTWGGYPGDPATGAGAYRLADVQRFVRAGGSVVTSFGGQAGTELAATCATAGTLATAYNGVVTAYRPRRIDFDIEGAAVADRTAISKRARAIATLEREHPRLRVSFTLPVLPAGLDRDALGVLRSAVAHHVRITYVNVMTMDYGDSAAPDPAGRMGALAIEAARHVARQLHRLYPRLSARRRMGMVGVTPMIGINDTGDEVFTLSDAAELARFARSRHVGLLAMWALNRDHRCPRPTTHAQVSCSGVVQGDWAFSRAFAP